MLPPGSLEGLSCFPGSSLLTHAKALRLQGSAASVGMGEPSAMTDPCPEPGAMGKGVRAWGGWEEEGGEHQAWRAPWPRGAEGNSSISWHHHTGETTHRLSSEKLFLKSKHPGKMVWHLPDEAFHVEKLQPHALTSLWFLTSPVGCCQCFQAAPSLPFPGGLLSWKRHYPHLLHPVPEPAPSVLLPPCSGSTEMCPVWVPLRGS